MKATIIDIKNAFLHGNLDEELYMDVPLGLIVESDKKVILHKTFYSLVQSAREFYKKLIKVLRLIGLLEVSQLPAFG